MKRTVKRLLAVLAIGSATILAGACASQGPSYGGGGGGFGYGSYLDDRYYDCSDSYPRYDCGYPNYYDRNPAAAPQRQAIIAGPVHRPITRVIERPVEGGGAATHSASRSFSRPRADVSVDSSGSSGGVSGSSGMSGGAPSSPPPSAPAPSFSAPAPSRAPEPVSVQRSPQ